MTLSGCVTSALWDAPLVREDTQTTRVLVAARANEARLLRELDRGVLYVRLEADGHPPCAFTLEPQRAFVERFNESMNCIPPAQLALRVLHRPWPAEGQHEWQVQLDRAQDAEPLATRVLFHVSPSREEPPQDGFPVTLHTVEWTEFGTTTTTTIDYGGIAGRIVATPFTVAADIVIVAVLAVPVTIIGGYLLLTDPGVFTGG
jgi:hypothetical protein